MIGLNSFTHGTEFYGPAADLSLLFELQRLRGIVQPNPAIQANDQDGTALNVKSPFMADDLYPSEDVSIGKLIELVLCTEGVTLHRL